MRCSFSRLTSLALATVALVIAGAGCAITEARTRSPVSTTTTTSAELDADPCAPAPLWNATATGNGVASGPGGGIDTLAPTYGAPGARPAAPGQPSLAIGADEAAARARAARHDVAARAARCQREAVLQRRATLSGEIKAQLDVVVGRLRHLEIERAAATDAGERAHADREIAILGAQRDRLVALSARVPTVSDEQWPSFEASVRGVLASLELP